MRSLLTRVSLFAVLPLGLLLLAASPAPAGLVLTLTDPISGQPQEVRPGARGLHVVLFATWCPECVDELDRLADLDSRWGSRGYELVLVAVQTRHDPARLRRFASRREIPGRLLFDATGEGEVVLKADGVPTHLLFDAEGREVARASSLEDGFIEQIQRLVSVRGRRSGR